ncbi:DUF4150 domain-containing protein, partial [Bordetella bronchiseptica]
MFADCQLMGMDLAFPDICKTPPALLPIPYPNFALGPMGIPNVWNVLLMAMPAHNLLTTIALSNGDNPGIGMGLISQTVMAQARRITCVPNVLFGCIPATRLTGLTVQNTINTVGMRVVPSQLKVVLLGGGGGGGGHGIRIDAADVWIELLATQVAGGQGGDGGAGSGGSGGGGDGGHGLAGAANDLRLRVDADSSLRGGDGGATWPVTHRAGAGGAGGAGLFVSASRWQVETAGLIQGGNGARGEASRELDGGDGGAGGAGIALAGDTGRLVNRGEIRGGSGATGGTSDRA